MESGFFYLWPVTYSFIFGSLTKIASMAAFMTRKGEESAFFRSYSPFSALQERYLRQSIHLQISI